MSILDDYINSPQPKLAGSDYTFIDGDTLKKDGESYRLQGLNTPETEKLGGGKYKTGQAGGEASIEVISNLANSQGFTEVVHILDADGNKQTDQFGRFLVDLKNPETGEVFKSRALQSGVLGVNEHTKAADQLTAQLGALRREQANERGESTTDTPWDKARVNLEEAIMAEGYKNKVFKQTALDEAELAAAKEAGVGHLYANNAVQVRDYGKTLANNSANPFSDSWEQGWIGVKESTYGMLNLIGDTTGIDAFADIGEAGKIRAQDQIKDYGKTLTDWKEVDDISSAFSYLSNNLALSLPYMAVTIGGTALAPVTGGASLLAPVSVYTGQTWNEMEGENKNAGIAIASGVVQATLDRLGIGVIFKSGAAPKSLLNKAVDKLVAGGMAKDKAKETVFAATRKEMANFIGDAAKVAKSQLVGKQIFKNLVTKAGVGGATEGVTEGLQEAVGYASAHWKEGFDYNELNERVLAGVIAGTALGGSISSTGAVTDAGAWADLAFRQAPADAANRSQAQKFADEEVAKNGRVNSINENNANTKARADLSTPNAHASVNERVDAHNANQKNKTTKELLTEAMLNSPALWRGAVRNIFGPDLLDRSRTARILNDMFGGGLQKVFSGSSYENAKHHKVSMYKNMVAIPEKLFSAMNGGKRAGVKKRGEISDGIYNTLRGAIDPNTQAFNPDLIPDTNPNKAMLVAFNSQLEKLANQMHNDQAKHNPNLGKLKNYLLKYKSFDKKSIYSNKTAFVQKLVRKTGMSEKDANEIADAITSNSEVNDLGAALDATQAAGRPGSHHKRTLNLSEDPEFHEFMERDIFANISSAAKAAARYTAHQEYVGDGHKNIALLLQDMQNEGVSETEVNRIANQLNNYLLAESGNYKRPKTAAGKRLQVIQRNFMMATTIAGLPLATISSFVEAALTFKGLRIDQIFGKGQTLEKFGTELGQTLWTGMTVVASTPTRKEVLPAETQGKEAIRELGFYDWDVGAATVTGATEINPWQQEVYTQFFKWTGLQGWTNFTRATRASIAGDYITDKLQVIFDGAGQPKNNEIQEAEESLRNLGINVNDMLDAYKGGGMFDPAKVDIIAENMREGTFNFINDAVALPQSANRPLIYQDPRFALFTQFQGFIATFTANHLPKLWGEYVKRGSPAMKYNAFATMTTMIMLGFASQYLKDLIKHGELREFGPGDHPFLGTSEYIQRGIRGSGLLGTGERVLDQFFPLYDQRSKGAGDWLWNTSTGESPALGFVKRILSTGKNVATGDIGRASRDAVRLTPFGVSHPLRDLFQNYGTEWNFKG